MNDFDKEALFFFIYHTLKDLCTEIVELRYLNVILSADEKEELGRHGSSFDHLLLEIPTQDIMIEATGEEAGKRKSPGLDLGAGAVKRRNSFKLDIVKGDK